MARSHITRIGVAALAVLAFAVAAAIAAADAGSGPVKGARYKGFTGPGYPMSFRVSANGQEIDDLVVAIEATCLPGAGSVAPKFDFKTLSVTHGKFSGSTDDPGDGGASNDLKIKGTFDGRKASGSVTDRAAIKSIGSCTETEPFTASAK
jgi:hypothetical protein